MRNGLVLFTSDRGITRAAAERGFDTFYVPEHTHIPVRRDAAHPGTGDESLPDDRYARTLDPWVSLATAAQVTSRIRLSTAVALPVESDPITLAKSIATLDHLSGGRVTIGAGGGPKTFAWIARTADGWMTTPIEGDIAGKADDLRAAWSAAGRSGAPQIHALAVSKPTPELLTTWEDAGVTDAIWGLPDKPHDEIVAF